VWVIDEDFTAQTDKIISLLKGKKADFAYLFYIGLESMPS